MVMYLTNILFFGGYGEDDIQMTSILEIDNMGDTLKIEVSESTTASDVVDIVNAKWPGCAELIEKIAASTDTTVADVEYSMEKLTRITQRIDFRSAMSGLESLNSAIAEKKRKQKAIDRIAWEAERQQRYQKGGHFK